MHLAVWVPNWNRQRLAWRLRSLPGGHTWPDQPNGLVQSGGDGTTLSPSCGKKGTEQPVSRHREGARVGVPRSLGLATTHTPVRRKFQDQSCSVSRSSSLHGRSLAHFAAHTSPQIQGRAAAWLVFLYPPHWCRALSSSSGTGLQMFMAEPVAGAALTDLTRWPASSESYYIRWRVSLAGVAGPLRLTTDRGPRT